MDNLTLSQEEGRLLSNPGVSIKGQISPSVARWSLRAIPVLGLYKSCCHIPLEFSVPNSQWLFPFLSLESLIGGPFWFQPDGKTWEMRIWREHWTCAPKCPKSPRTCPVQGLNPGVSPPSCSFCTIPQDSGGGEGRDPRQPCLTQRSPGQLPEEDRFPKMRAFII